MYAKLDGSYKDIASSVGFGFLLELETNRNKKKQIELDIGRIAFVSFSNSFGDFTKTWQSEDVSPAYSQGNMNASVFDQLLRQAFVGQSEESSLLKKLKEIDTTRLEHIRKSLGSSSLNFAYYNDQDVVCGVSIDYIQDFPDLWIATIITNTTADVAQRRVQIFGTPEIINANNKQNQLACVPVDIITEPRIEFLQELGSQSIADLLTKVWTADNQINHDEVKILKTRIATNRNIDNWDEILRELDPLVNRALHQKNIDDEAKQMCIKKLWYPMIHAEYLRKKVETKLNDKELIKSIFQEQEQLLAFFIALRVPFNTEPQLWQRNYGAIFFITVGLLATVGCLLLLSSPLGLMLGAVATGLVMTGAILSALLTAAATIKLSLSELDYKDYQERKQYIEEIHQKNALEFSAQRSQKEQVKADAALETEPYSRAAVETSSEFSSPR